MPASHGFGRRVVDSAVFAGNSVKGLNSSSATWQINPEEVRGQICVKLCKSRGKRTYQMKRLTNLGIDTVSLCRILTRREIEFDSGVATQSLDYWCEGRIVHRSSRIDEQPPLIRPKNTLPLLIKSTK